MIARVRLLIAAVVAAREAVEDGDQLVVEAVLERAEHDLLEVVSALETEALEQTVLQEELEAVLSRLAEVQAANESLQRGLDFVLSALRAELPGLEDGEA